MKIDLTKYVKNDDVKVSNDDFDIDTLKEDLLKGYTKDSEVEKKVNNSLKDMVSKTDYDKLQKDYTQLETNYNNTIKTLDDTNTKMARVNLENKLTRKGFKEEDFDDVINIRNSIFSSEKDDNKAIDEIATRFKGTYFPEDNKQVFTKAPDEAPINNSNNKVENIKITRNTSVKDLLIKK